MTSHSTAPKKITAQKTTASGLTLEAAYDGISYTIRKRKQAKRMVLRVSSDGRVWVSVPLRASVRDAEEFFAKNIEFVRSALVKIQESKQQQTSPQTAPTLDLPIAGVWYPVVITLREQNATKQFDIELFPTHCVIAVPAKYAGDEAVMRSEAAKYWQYVMIQRANAVLPKRTQELAAALGETVRRIAVKDQRSLWGSCVKSRRSINLNWRSVLFPEEVRDYLIIHELAHLRHANHSEAYWRHVAECCEKAGCQDYRLSEKWLKQNGRRIMSLRNLFQ